MSRMFVWGKASSGQLALGGIEEDFIKTPVEVPPYDGFSSKVRDVACGWEHTAFLTNDGVVYTCGNNDFGQLGHSKSSKRPGIVCQRSCGMRILWLENFTSHFSML